MRDIIISIRNDFVAEAVIRCLAESGDFNPFKLLFMRDGEVVEECETMQPDMLLSEVAFGKHLRVGAGCQESQPGDYCSYVVT